MAQDVGRVEVTPKMSRKQRRQVQHPSHALPMCVDEMCLKQSLCIFVGELGLISCRMLLSSSTPSIIMWHLFWIHLHSLFPVCVCVCVCVCQNARHERELARRAEIEKEIENLPDERKMETDAIAKQLEPLELRIHDVSAPDVYRVINTFL